jgi:hypothetical protein
MTAFPFWSVTYMTNAALLLFPGAAFIGLAPPTTFN